MPIAAVGWEPVDMTQDYSLANRFSGKVANVQLVDLIQMVCLARSNHAIAVQSNLGKGMILARSGKLYHARCGDLQGEEALFEILRWLEGKFVATLHDATKATVATLNRPWEYLLIEGARSRYEPDATAGGTGREYVTTRGFTGAIKDIQLTDLVQLMCQSRLEQSVRVVSQKGSGTIHASSGQVCHAEVSDLEGIDAFFKIFRWSEGFFETLPPTDIDHPTIEVPWEYLLMEAMRQRDEESAPPEEVEEGISLFGDQAFLRGEGGPEVKEADVGIAEADGVVIPPLGFSGTVTHVQLTDLVQLICLARSNHKIETEAAKGTGTIYLGAGQIYHAESNGLEGEEAFFDMHRWSGGSVKALPIQDKRTKETIQKAWEYLLIEGARYRGDMMAADTGATEVGHSATGLSGIINGIELADLMHLVCIARSSFVIHLKSHGNIGTIYARGGQIFHAETDGLQGLEAFFHVFRWPNGRFDLEVLADDEVVDPTIDMPWEYLLMEAMRVRDEQSELAEDEEPLDELEAFTQRLQKMKAVEQLESFTQRLMKMMVTEKIRLALTGDKEARTMLIRDSNRMIQIAVITNPRISDNEVVAIANSKAVDEEVLRKIAANRKWSKNYSLRVALVNNPKTPLPVAISMVNTLMSRDLKMLSRSKTIPTAVAQAAARRMRQHH